MYAAGASHPYEEPSRLFLERVARTEIDALVDAEVLQEILHRYRAIGRWKDGRQVFELTRKIVPEVLPITAEILDEAKKLLDVYPNLMARDALHAAACMKAGCRAICSYDRDFDRIENLERMEPSNFLT